MLTPEEARSGLWKKLKARLTDDLEELRTRLESDLSPERTAALRGEIKRIRYVLSLEALPAMAHESDEDA